MRAVHTAHFVLNRRRVNSYVAELVQINPAEITLALHVGKPYPDKRLDFLLARTTSRKSVPRLFMKRHKVMHESGEVNFCFRMKVEVDGSFGNTGLSRDRIYRGPLVARASERVRCRFKDHLASELHNHVFLGSGRSVGCGSFRTDHMVIIKYDGSFVNECQNRNAFSGAERRMAVTHVYRSPSPLQELWKRRGFLDLDWRCFGCEND